MTLEDSARLQRIEWMVGRMVMALERLSPPPDKPKAEVKPADQHALTRSSLPQLAQWEREEQARRQTTG